MNTHHHANHSTNGHSANVGGETTVTDPVCGMQGVSAETKHHSEHQGTTYYFCSARCRERFVDNPGQYLSGKPVEAPNRLPADTMYTCPMHPQISQSGPGTCPICGMALELEMPSLDDEENLELQDFSHRFWWTLPLTLVVLTLAMFGHYFTGLAVETRTWIELVLTIPVVLWAAGRSLFGAFNRSVTSVPICGR